MMKTIDINLVGERTGSKTALGALGNLRRLNLDYETLAPGVLALVAALIAPNVISWGVDTFLIAPTNARMEELQRDIGSNNSKAKKLARTQKQTTALESDYNALLVLSQQGSTWKTVLEQLRDYTPVDLWLTKMSFGKDSKLRIEGSALDYKSIAYFFTNLQGSTTFLRPVLGPMTSAEQGGQLLVNFSIDCELAPRTGG